MDSLDKLEVVERVHLKTPLDVDELAALIDIALAVEPAWRDCSRRRKQCSRSGREMIGVASGQISDQIIVAPAEGNSFTPGEKHDCVRIASYYWPGVALDSEQRVWGQGDVVRRVSGFAHRIRSRACELEAR